MAGLYVHIPFCGQRCAYCDFYKSTDGGRAEAFLDALGREMELRRDRQSLPVRAGRPRLDTIYMGGGTPSVLPPGQLQAILNRAAELWDCLALGEVTVEANPEDLTDDYLARLAETGFNRLSMGVQSFDDAILRLMNRRHTARRATEAVRAARRAGFGNITIDLIYGIPGMTAAQWERTLDEAVAMGVQHISAYHLTIEPGTAFGRRGLKSVAEAESERQYELLRRKLSDAGFEQYEISNFALPGRRAVHNSAYWSGEPYWGVGPSAHSFDGLRRREWVTANLDRYIAALGGGKAAEGRLDPPAVAEAIYDGETLTDTDLRNERIMTALRTTEGIAARELPPSRQLERLAAEGLLVRCGERVAVPAERFLLSDYVIASLFE
jgi:oxygen-independent coproporphyrinogen-3 oxidase